MSVLFDSDKVVTMPALGWRNSWFRLTLPRVGWSDFEHIVE